MLKRVVGTVQPKNCDKFGTPCPPKWCEEHIRTNPLPRTMVPGGNCYPLSIELSPNGCSSRYQTNEYIAPNGQKCKPILPDNRDSSHLISRSAVCVPKNNRITTEPTANTQVFWEQDPYERNCNKPAPACYVLPNYDVYGNMQEEQFDGLVHWNKNYQGRLNNNYQGRSGKNLCPKDVVLQSPGRNVCESLYKSLNNCTEKSYIDWGIPIPDVMPLGLQIDTENSYNPSVHMPLSIVSSRAKRNNPWDYVPLFESNRVYKEPIIPEKTVASACGVSFAPDKTASRGGCLIQRQGTNFLLQDCFTHKNPRTGKRECKVSQVGECEPCDLDFFGCNLRNNYEGRQKLPNIDYKGPSKFVPNRLLPKIP